ncbi:MAG: prolipoprotein diacylglyceryl transferase family protein, partial [Mycobacterium sp.]
STGELVAVVHPTFLYELVWNLLIFALLIWIDRRYKLGHGKVLALYVAGYCLGRFWIELLRADPATLFAGIRVNSFTSTFVFIAAVVYVMVAPKGREDPATLRGNTDVDEESVVDDVATEVIEMGAAAGVVAAAKVAGADADSVKPDADDAADDLEKPVETEVFEAIESEPESAQEVVEDSVVEDSVVEDSEGDSVTAESVDVDDESEELAHAAEPVAEEPAEDAIEVAAETEPEQSADEPAETEESPEAEAADGESEDAECAVGEPAVVESDEAPIDEAAEPETESDAPEAEQSAEAETAEAEGAEGDSGDADVAVEEPVGAEPARRWWRRQR